MNWYAAASFLSFLSALVLGIAVVMRDAQSLLNRAFFFLSCTVAASLLVDFGLGVSTTPEQARVWWHLDCTWPLIYPGFLHFVLVYTKQRALLQRKVTYFVLYVPAAAMVLLELFTEQITPPPRPVWWGWTYMTHGWTPVGTVVVCWNFLLTSVAVLLIAHFCIHAKGLWEKRSSRVIAIGTSIPVVVGVVTELLVPLSGIEFPGLGKTAFLLGSGFFTWAIWKYHVFELTPAHASDSIIETMADALLLVDANGEVIAANRAATRLLGYRREELLGLSCEAAFGESVVADALRPLSMLETPSSARTGGEVDTQITTARGDCVPVTLSWSLLTGARGRPMGIVYIARDISERKRTEAELARYREHLEDLVASRTEELEASNRQLRHAQKMEALGELAGGVAHDFNNLLTGILGNLNLARFAQDRGAIEGRLAEAEKAALRAANLVRQLLMFSRAPKVTTSAIDIGSLIEEVVSIVHETFDRRIEIRLRKQEGVQPILADAGQIHQVLLNLCVNARDALEQVPPSDPPALLQITVQASNVRVDAPPASSAPDAKPGDYVRVSISDTGVGMDADTQAHIFEPFFTTKEPGKGTGLGLATVFGIVKQHKGWIKVESRAGQGSTFHVYLPAVGAGEDRATAREAKGAPIPTGTETILVVDDENIILQIAEEMLERLGYTTMLASDGAEALRMFEKHGDQISAVILDLSMPLLSGQEVLRQMRAVDPDVKVLISSGYAEESVKVSLEQSGAVAFLAKPYRLNDLAAILRDVLDGKVL